MLAGTTVGTSLVLVGTYVLSMWQWFHSAMYEESECVILRQTWKQNNKSKITEFDT